MFAAIGAEVYCSYYRKPPGSIENGQLRVIRAKYGLDEKTTFDASITEIEGTSL
jgi:hypothetical protein